MKQIAVTHFNKFSFWVGKEKYFIILQLPD